MTRENLYIAVTRGREASTAYVAVDRPMFPPSGRERATTRRPRDAASWDRYGIVGASALGMVPELAAQPRNAVHVRSARVAAKRIVEE
jgi:hypothetical protein